MPVRNQSIQYDISAKEAVLSFIEALNDNDFDGARTHIDDNMVFEGVMGSRHGADRHQGPGCSDVSGAPWMRAKLAEPPVLNE